MAEGVRRDPEGLYALSLNRPVVSMLVLFVIAVLIKVLDSMVFRLDEVLGELIVTKALGFLLVWGYVWVCGRTLRAAGFHRRQVWPALLICGATISGLFIVSHAVPLVVMLAAGQEVSLALSAVDPITGMQGGLLFAGWLLVGNLVNSAMEEGLFRGLMLPHFRARHSVWGAILLQALLFALWHLNWPVKQFVTGRATLGEAAFGALSLLIATGISGVVYGYMYHRTDNLWGPYLAHAINNTVLNVVFFRTAAGLQSGTELGLFLALWLPGYLLLLPLVGWWGNRLNLPQVQPWGHAAPAP